MPKYKYSAASPDGMVVTGVESAAGVEQARAQLLARSLQPLNVSLKTSILQFEITPKKVKKRYLMHFCRQLAVFVRSGVSVIEALYILSEESTDKLMGKALEQVRLALESGSTFAGAAAQHPELFPGYTVEVLQTAELTGRLDDVLDQLGDYLERELDTEHKIRSALAYPSIVVLLAIAVSTTLVVYVLPKFRAFFKTLNAKLPLATRILLSFANWIGRWGVYVGVALLVAALAVALTLRTEQGRVVRDNVLIRLPMVGDLLYTSIVERFCRLLASMTAAGVSLPEALAVTTAATNNAVFRDRLTLARHAMLRGEGLAGPLGDTGLFPGAARQMFTVGETTGSLDDQLQAAASYFDRELDYKLKRFTTLIEPAVITVVGLIVGFVAIALISAMYGIFRQVKVS
ncbi:MAG: type II secretion system F family protein [Actinomycetota bacterium]|nr:type II secretion system F family protein [Actinomycetota bacterium]